MPFAGLNEELDDPATSGDNGAQVEKEEGADSPKGPGGESTFDEGEGGIGNTSILWGSFVGSPCSRPFGACPFLHLDQGTNIDRLSKSVAGEDEVGKANAKRGAVKEVPSRRLISNSDRRCAKGSHKTASRIHSMDKGEPSASPTDAGCISDTASILVCLAQRHDQKCGGAKREGRLPGAEGLGDDLKGGTDHKESTEVKEL